MNPTRLCSAAIFSNSLDGLAMKRIITADYGDFTDKKTTGTLGIDDGVMSAAECARPGRSKPGKRWHVEFTGVCGHPDVAAPDDGRTPATAFSAATDRLPRNAAPHLPSSIFNIV